MNPGSEQATAVNAFLLAGLLAPGGFAAPGGTPDLALLRRAIDACLRAPDRSVGLGRFMQRVRGRGGDLYWEDSPPDLTWHIRSVDPVPGVQGLADLAAQLMTRPLPADRPLWELLVVPGATPTAPGIILRVHHCVAGGVAGVRLVRELFGGDADETRAAPTIAAPRRPTSLRRRIRRVAAGLVRVAAVIRPTVARTVLLGPIGPRRGVAFVDGDLGAVSAGAKRVGATVNDALLAAVAGGAEAALREAGQPVPHVLPASVPVALPGGHGRSGNAVGVMLARLPTGVADAADRMVRIAAVTREAKEAARDQGSFELTRSRWGSRIFARLARRQRFIALFVTNVRGPERPLAVAGAPLLHAWPVAPIQGNVRLGVAAMSYAGRLEVAVHADADALNAAVLGRALAAELRRGSAPAPQG
ncbi:hypothetical protein BCR15_12780 [Tessaracoccus lapidicaptus]|uniref:diacylglycerol O-acyltransferase n=1 Tax=Tessaracoccus lapidicaptus TaxID=1427523 RepID=A0A1C0ARM1_9ACTN|nr:MULTISPECIES: wax ester/triacylglycerol synthase domain-containing protein [Tessaracoccus]AQX16177.1 hypothetical protein BKM78_09845 [Tessaracoccus sp. T2.5-30]OCL36950.1 hypothetical protein BCR15_12780 [Tessaracoccus lapidicaptus]VEP40753.1 putative diacyglycerol O-acyltransferase tgs1 [Tessaracoccus lapidicaptus]